MGKFYFFTSSNKKDKVRVLNIYTISIEQAYILANRYFHNNKCKGVPKILAI